MIYVLLMTFFLDGGLIRVGHTTMSSLPDCYAFQDLVAKDELRQHPDWDVTWIDLKCIKVKKETV